jgi:hypothetical protein
MPPNQDHNYYSTFISVADDCPATVAEEPPHRAGGLTAAQVHLQMARDQPYAYKQEQILFRAHLNSKGIDPHDEYEGGTRWTQFLSTGQPCLRTSALAKRYGWGFHFDDRGQVMAVPAGSDEYRRLSADSNLRQLKAMRSRRA